MFYRVMFTFFYRVMFTLKNGSGYITSKLVCSQGKHQRSYRQKRDIKTHMNKD